jgi:hypothetical protein
VSVYICSQNGAVVADVQNAKMDQLDEASAKFSNGIGAWQWSQSYRFIGMDNYGFFDVSEDYAGKYTI